LGCGSALTSGWAGRFLGCTDTQGAMATGTCWDSCLVSDWHSISGLQWTLLDVCPKAVCLGTVRGLALLALDLAVVIGHLKLTPYWVLGSTTLQHFSFTLGFTFNDNYDM